MAKAPQPRRWARALAIWMNAIADAWNMGEADWAYVDGRSMAVRAWATVFDSTGDEQAATDAVIALARERGVDPKHHKIHAR